MLEFFRISWRTPNKIVLETDIPEGESKFDKS